jgi:hypothetical protein
MMDGGRWQTTRALAKPQHTRQETLGSELFREERVLEELQMGKWAKPDSEFLWLLVHIERLGILLLD